MTPFFDTTIAVLTLIFAGCFLWISFTPNRPKLERTLDLTATSLLVAGAGRLIQLTWGH